VVVAAGVLVAASWQFLLAADTVGDLIPAHPRISPHSWHATVEAEFERPPRKCCG
jgi:hypothetical protein